MSAITRPGSPPVSLKRIFITWWPLAASWLLMSLEGPAISAIVARLVDPKINLAAYGAIVLPISLIIEAPIIMLLSASTAMSKDWASYQKLHRFMMTAGALLTGVHALVAFTPLYFVVVTNIIGVPPELVIPGRYGLMNMLPWTWAIAYRRFNQGVMIRFGFSGSVMQCTMVRLVTLVILLVAGYKIGNIPGVIVASIAQALGVTFEAIYAGWRVRPIVKNQVRNAPPAEAITWRGFSAFYLPLVFTALLQFLGQPIGSAALSRMPQALDSLAVWGVLFNFVFLTRSVAMALNEVVVALLDQPGAYCNLRRFTNLLALALSSFILLVATTPLSLLWFEKVTGLAPDLSQMARSALWLLLLMPGLAAFQSWFQGSILHGRKTRAITEAVVVFLVTLSAVLVAGIAWGQMTGLYVGAFAFMLANITQTLWLLVRSRKVRQQAKLHDTAVDQLQPGCHLIAKQ